MVIITSYPTRANGIIVYSKFSNRVLSPIFISTILQSVRKENLTHYFPYDVKLGLLAHSRSFLANLKDRNAIVGAENLLNYNGGHFGIRRMGQNGIRPHVTRHIKHKRPCLTTFSNAEYKVENMTRSGVFLTIFEVFGNVVKRYLVLGVISQTRETVFHQNIQTPRRELKIRREVG